MGTIVGDIHGQFDDLKQLISIAGSPKDVTYLFLGDFVDRGEASIRTICLCWLLKLRYPDRMFLLRGNHECRSITQCYGFYDECVMLFGNTLVWSAFMRAFDCLPLTAMIEGRIFCTHAGLSPNLSTLDDIRQLDRFREVPHDGPICDLLWSDPWEHPGWSFSYRGAGYQFGQDISEQFNHENGADFIARAHHVVMEGYEWHHDRNVVTVFSAPNYGGQVGNLGAFMCIDEHFECNFTTLPNASTQGELDVTPSLEVDASAQKESVAVDDQRLPVHFYGCVAGA